jgi:hypothetical protein
VSRDTVDELHEAEDHIGVLETALRELLVALVPCIVDPEEFGLPDDASTDEVKAYEAAQEQLAAAISNATVVLDTPFCRCPMNEAGELECFEEGSTCGCQCGVHDD